MRPTARQDRGDPASTGVRPVVVSSRRRLAPVVYDLLKDRLLEGEFQAGERLSVEALKAEFGVSKQPIMEALHRLSSEGLVEIIPQVGCRIPVYDSADVRTSSPSSAAWKAPSPTSRPSGALQDQVEELAAVNDKIRQLIADPDPSARAHGYRVLNRRFHGIIHDMTHSAVVAGISRRMWDMSDPMINTSGIPQPLASAVPARHDDHELIIRALRERDQAARQAMENHITGTVAIINTEARAAC